MAEVGVGYIPIRPDFKQFNKAADAPAKSAGKRIAKIVGAAVIAAGVLKEVKKSVAVVLSLAKGTAALSRSTGMDTKSASRWISSMKARGVEANKLQVSFTALSRQIIAAQNGSKTTRKEFKALGVSMDVIKRGDMTEILGEMADGFKDLKDGPEKTALAAKLFGRNYQAILPILNEGKASMEDALAVSDKYGNTLSKKQVAAALKAAKAQREFGMAVDGLRIKLGVALMPVIATVTQHAAEMIGQLQSGEGPIGRIGSIIGGVARDLASIVVPIIKLLADTISGLPGPMETVIGLGATFAQVLGATGPMGLAIVAIAAGAVLIKRNWDTIGPVFQKVVDAIAPVVKTVTDTVMPIIKDIPGALSDAFDAMLPTINAIPGALTEVVDAMLPTINAIPDAVSTAFTAASQWVQQAIVNISNWLDLGSGKTGDFRQAMTNIFTGVKAAVTVAVGVFKWAFENVLLPITQRTLPAIQKQIQGTFQVIGGVIKLFTGIFTGDFGKMWDGIKQIFSGGLNVMLGVIKQFLAPVRVLGGLLMKGLGAAIRAGAKLVVSAAKAAGNALWDYVSYWPKKMFGIGKSIVSKFAEGLSGLGSALGRALKGGFNFFGNLGRGIADWINANTPLGDQISLNLGVKKIKFKLPALWKGGVVPGQGPWQLAEVNERGPESITDKRGRTTMLGDGRRQVMQLPVGWRVNTAGQTKRMMGDVPGYADGGVVRYKRGLGKGVGISNKRMPYQYGGNGNPSYDCSAYVSAMLNAAGFGFGRETTVTLRQKLARGAGKIVTVGVRGGAGRNGHTMLKWGKRFFESGGGHGPAEVGGWNGSFDMYHPGNETSLLRIPGGGGGGGGASKARAKKIAAKVKANKKAQAIAKKGLSSAKWDLAIARAESTAGPEDDIKAYRGRREYFKNLAKQVEKLLAKKGLKPTRRLELTERLTQYIGQIKADNDQVYNLLNPDSSSTGSTSTGEGGSGSDDGRAALLAQLLSNSQNNERLLRAQMPVFQRFAGLPFAGKFHGGGVVPGSPFQESLALVRGQETITPAGSAGEPNFTLQFEDGAFVDGRFDESKVRLIIKDENRRMVRRARSGPVVGLKGGFGA